MVAYQIHRQKSSECITLYNCYYGQHFCQAHYECNNFAHVLRSNIFFRESSFERLSLFDANKQAAVIILGFLVRVRLFSLQLKYIRWTISYIFTFTNFHLWCFKPFFEYPWLLSMWWNWRAESLCWQSPARYLEKDSHHGNYRHGNYHLGNFLKTFLLSLGELTLTERNLFCILLLEWC